MRLTPKELRRLERHYTGNCFSCDRCVLYERIQRGEPGAVEAYVQLIAEVEGRKVQTRP